MDLWKEVEDEQGLPQDHWKELWIKHEFIISVICSLVSEGYDKETLEKILNVLMRERVKR